MAAVGDLYQSLARLRESMGVQKGKQGGIQTQVQHKLDSGAHKDEQLAKRPNSQLSTKSGHPGRATSTAPRERETCHSTETERQTEAISTSPDGSFRDEVQLDGAAMDSCSGELVAADALADGARGAIAAKACAKGSVNRSSATLLPDRPVERFVSVVPAASNADGLRDSQGPQRGSKITCSRCNKLRAKLRALEDQLRRSQIDSSVSRSRLLHLESPRVSRPRQRDPGFVSPGTVLIRTPPGVQARHNAAMSELRRQLEEQQARISKLEQLLKSRTTQVELRNHILRQKERDVHMLERALAEREGEIEAMGHVDQVMHEKTEAMGHTGQSSHMHVDSIHETAKNAIAAGLAALAVVDQIT